MASTHNKKKKKRPVNALEYADSLREGFKQRLAAQLPHVIAPLLHAPVANLSRTIQAALTVIVRYQPPSEQNGQRHGYTVDVRFRNEGAFDPVELAHIESAVQVVLSGFKPSGQKSKGAQAVYLANGSQAIQFQAGERRIQLTTETSVTKPAQEHEPVAPAPLVKETKPTVSWLSCVPGCFRKANLSIKSPATLQEKVLVAIDAAINHLDNKSFFLGFLPCYGDDKVWNAKRTALDQIRALVDQHDDDAVLCEIMLKTANIYGKGVTLHHQHNEKTASYQGSTINYAAINQKQNPFFDRRIGKKDTTTCEILREHFAALGIRHINTELSKVNPALVASFGQHSL